MRYLPALPLAAVFALVSGLSVARAALTPAQVAQLPAPATRPVDFARDIQPIFEASCVQCHARGKAKGSFSLETRADFLTGGDAGPAAVSGRSAESLVVEMISGLNPENIMPEKGKRLTRDQVALFRAWIDQDLPWPAEINFLKREPANLRPRDLAAPPAKPGLTHPIDRHLDAYFASQRLAWPQPVDDATFARRVYLDTVGLLPTPAELDAFVADRTADKRERLVTRLLADNQRYAEHWLSFWNDLLRNDYKGTGYIDGGRRPITRWLYTALVRNLPYDRFVAELVNPGAEAEGFTSGIVWRGAVNASMVPPMQAAQSVAQVFLGVNLKCASCHDSFIDEYTLADAYGIAAIYADSPLEVAECDKPTGKIAKVKFLYPELGTIDPRADPAARKQQLMEIITGRQNGRLPRTVVNRLWQRLLGHGFVEPVDEMDKPAWSPALLDWLAEDLVAHRYDLKHTLARILTSRAYQLPAVSQPENETHYVFRGPTVRRLSAEQFSDALLAVTRQTLPRADARINRLAALQPAAEPLPLQPKWIWGTAGADRKARPGTFVFTRSVTLDAAPQQAQLAISADDNYNLRINNKAVASSGRRNSTGIDWIDLTPHLKSGVNVFEVTASNMPPDEGRLVSLKTDEVLNPDSPAGLILYARIRTPDATVDLVSDSSWTVTSTGRAPDPRAILVAAVEPPAKPGPAIELGGLDLAPWRLGHHFLDVAAAPADKLPVERSSLVAADPLMTALGRPNREQIATTRLTTATTLQALELTNGSTLAKSLKAGAAKLLAAHAGQSAAQIVDSVYRHTLGRLPNPRERAAAVELVGAPATAEHIEDLLWALTMLPEFQLIY